MEDQERTNRVVVTGLDIPFGDLLAFMVKAAFAAIPAMLLVSIVAGAAWLFFVVAVPKLLG